MNSGVTTREAVQLVQGLLSKLSDLQKREQTLKSEHTARAAAFQKRNQEENRRAQEARQLQLGEQERQRNEGAARLAARIQARTARLRKAGPNSRKQFLDKIEAIEGRRKYSAQRGIFEADRARTAKLAEEKAAFESLREEVEASRQPFEQLGRSTRRTLGIFPGFRGLLKSAAAAPFDANASARTLFALRGERQQQIERGSRELKNHPLALFFRILPLWLWGLIAAAIIFAGPRLEGWTGIHLSQKERIAGGAILLAVMMVLHAYARKKLRPVAQSIAANLASLEQITDLLPGKAQLEFESNSANIEKETRDLIGEWQGEWDAAIAEGTAARESGLQKVENKTRRASLRFEQWRKSITERAEQARARAEHAAGEEAARASAALQQAQKEAVTELEATFQERVTALRQEWRELWREVEENARSLQDAASKEFPDWSALAEANWRPPAEFRNRTKWGSVHLDFSPVSLPSSELRPPQGLALPLLLKFPNEGSLLLEARDANRAAAVGAINAILFRLLAMAPPGKIAFTLIDPVALGQSFPAIMHLADYEESLVHGKIWTEPQQIEERLLELNAHMEKVIQMYLRNEFPTIVEYNAQAGKIAEKYHFLVVADFPANFSEQAIRRLLKIAESGARCGVYILLHWNKGLSPLNPALALDEIAKHAAAVLVQDGRGVLAGAPPRVAAAEFDRPPAPDLATRFLHNVGRAHQGASRVEVPFSQIAPREDQLWSMDTTDELRVSIGRSGASKLQQMALGKGTRQHVLVAGKTGSGKSTLFHVLITNLALWHSPDQVQFYLIDFKKGVEFKDYAAEALPHARVIAIESDREFGLSVLRRVDEELRLRGEIFRAAGAQDVAGYKRISGKALPRVLLIVDEFQELFVEDDAASQTAAMLLDRIVRQGRAFGIHVVLGSQTLGGAYTLARTTLGQMVVRIALQCNEADAYLIMDETNPAPRLLSRPGEGIYNDMAGAVEGNSPFQTVWLGEEERRAALQKVRALAAQKLPAISKPMVFEGNAPADLRENEILAAVARRPAENSPKTPRVWLGLPNEIKGPTEAVLGAQSGSNLLVAGQREEAALSLLSASLVALTVQFPPGAASFYLLDGSAPESAEKSYLKDLLQRLPAKVELLSPATAGSAIEAAADQIRLGVTKPCFILVHRVQNFKNLRQEDEFSFSTDDSKNQTAVQFQTAITEGPALGIHFIATVDNLNNVMRFIGRKGLREFSMRVLFQMSPNDSAALCDDPRASHLGLHRALLYNEQQGSLETFRPYALPSREALEELLKGR